MKKKGFIALGVVGLLAMSLTIPEVSAFAMSAMSVFRVADAKTITVTIDDITNASAYMKEKSEEYEAEGKAQGFESEDFEELEYEDYENSDFEGMFISESTRELESASEFTYFPVRLPETEDAIPPEIAVIEFKEQNFTTVGGEEVSVSFSPAFFAAGEKWLYFATQGFNENFSDEAKQKIKDHVLELPFLSESLSSQIAKIPIDTKDIYLPVIEGISRSVDIGGNTGYIYNTSDFSLIMDSLPEEAAWEIPDEEDIANVNVTAVVWVNDGVLNVFAGSNMPEAELVKLAGSVSR